MGVAMGRGIFAYRRVGWTGLNSLMRAGALALSAVAGERVAADSACDGHFCHLYC